MFLRCTRGTEADGKMEWKVAVVSFRVIGDYSTLRRSDVEKVMHLLLNEWRAAFILRTCMSIRSCEKGAFVIGERRSSAVPSQGETGVRF